MSVVTVGGNRYEAITLEIDNGLALITLNRPEARNAIDNTMGLELLKVFGAVADDGGVRAVVLTGAGSAFCAGADLRAERELTPSGHQDLGGRLRRRTNPMIATLRLMPKPVVAAVNGPAVGIGCSIALACDLILAGESANFALGFSAVGLSFDGGCSTFLPARVGVARATELAMLGRRLETHEALDWGLINQVHPDAELLIQARSLATDLARGPTLAFANQKRALNASAYPNLTAQLELEAELQQHQAESGDFSEALAAFRDKRRPVFTGA